MKRKEFIMMTGVTTAGILSGSAAFSGVSGGEMKMGGGMEDGVGGGMRGADGGFKVVAFDALQTIEQRVGRLKEPATAK